MVLQTFHLSQFTVAAKNAVILAVAVTVVDVAVTVAVAVTFDLALSDAPLRTKAQGHQYFVETLAQPTANCSVISCPWVGSWAHLGVQLHVHKWLHDVEAHSRLGAVPPATY